MPNKVLIIDDSDVIRKLATTLLSKKGYEVVTAENGFKGIELAGSSLLPPQVILLDVMMPEIDGFEVCRRLKENDATKDIPVIMVTSKSDSIEKIKGLEIGAADYVTKPFNHGELIARVATQVKMKNLWDELQKKNRILEELVKKDGLTNLYNHRFFQEKMVEEFNRSQRHNIALCCALIDIDYFKNINDTYGHQAGDLILKSLAGLVIENLRNYDLAARYGGEEFALILPHTVIESAENVSERIRKSVQEKHFTFNDLDIKITVSIGVAEAAKSRAETPGQLIKFADESLYKAKEAGRNRVELHEIH